MPKSLHEQGLSVSCCPAGLSGAEVRLVNATPGTYGTVAPCPMKAIESEALASSDQLFASLLHLMLNAQQARYAT